MKQPTQQGPDRRDYESAKGIARWWAKDGAFHIALPNEQGDFLWTAAQFNTRVEAIRAIEHATF